MRLPIPFFPGPASHRGDGSKQQAPALVIYIYTRRPGQPWARALVPGRAAAAWYFVYIVYILLHILYIYI